MNRNVLRVGLGVAVSAVVASTAVAAAQGDSGRDHDDHFETSARLSGFNEDPLALSTSGEGEFRAKVDGEDRTIEYELMYRRLEGDVLEVHLHIGKGSQSGGVSVFLCSNLPDPPPGTPECDADGTVRGTLEATDVIGPADQGIDAGEFFELVNAIEHKAVYANVHSSKYPGGEIRGQLRTDD